LRNLLQRQGYENLDAVLAQGKAEGMLEGKAEGIVKGHARAVIHLLRRRDLPISAELEHRIMACRDPDQLNEWLFAATLVTRAEDITGGDGTGHY